MHFPAITVDMSIIDIHRWTDRDSNDSIAHSIISPHRDVTHPIHVIIICHSRRPAIALVNVVRLVNAFENAAAGSHQSSKRRCIDYQCDKRRWRCSASTSASTSNSVH
jgi:hypothetical protein